MVSGLPKPCGLGFSVLALGPKECGVVRKTRENPSYNQSSPVKTPQHPVNLG